MIGKPVGVVAFSVLYALPNVFPQDPSVQVTATRSEAVDEALGRIHDRLADLEQLAARFGSGPEGADGHARQARGVLE